MELTNDFRVAVPVERAWEVLTDVEQAPLHDALPLVVTVPSATDTVLLA